MARPALASRLLLVLSVGLFPYLACSPGLNVGGSGGQAGEVGMGGSEPTSGGRSPGPSGGAGGEKPSAGGKGNGSGGEEGEAGGTRNSGGSGGGDEPGSGGAEAKECSSSAMESCGAVYGSKGVCASRMLTCSTKGRWPSEDECIATAAENCLNDKDDNCDGEVNEASACPCVENPCQNGGICEPTAGSDYTCSCDGIGYVGDHCEYLVVKPIPFPPGETSVEIVAVSDSGIIAANFSSGSYQRGYFYSGGSWQQAQPGGAYRNCALAALSADGNQATGIVTDGGANLGARWNSRTQPATLLSSPSGVRPMAMSGDGIYVGGLNAAGEVVRWQGSAAAEVYVDNAFAGSITGVVMSDDGSKLAAYQDGYGGMSIWTSKTTVQEVTDTENVQLNVRRLVAISNDGASLAGYGETNQAPFQGRLFTYQDDEFSFRPFLDQFQWSADGADRTATQVLGWGTSSRLVLWHGGEYLDIRTMIEESGSSVEIGEFGRADISRNGKWIAVPENISTSTTLFLVRLP